MRIAPTTDLTLPWVDYSTLTAVNTCPRWGLIHSWHGKRLTGGTERTLPLEAGRAMHDVFACARFFDLLTHVEKDGDNPHVLAAIHAHAMRIFNTPANPDRWNTALRYYRGTEDAETRCMQMALSLLETSGYHDDPRDTRRTQSNLESAAIAYLQRYPLGRFIPIYEHLTGKNVGIEIPFDVTLHTDDDIIPPIRFVGRVDAVCHDTLRPRDPIPEVHENKTGARIDGVWSSSFDTSHQVTGYCIAMTCVLGLAIDKCVMWGLQIPIPKSSSYSDGVMRYPVTRDAHAFNEWMAWVVHTVNMINIWKDKPTNAPMYTHSCNRYFRSCAFIPLCVESAERRLDIFNNEMTTDRWTPLDVEISQ